MCAGSIEQSSLIYTGCPNRSVAFLVPLERNQPYTLLPARATGVERWSGFYGTAGLSWSFNLGKRLTAASLSHRASRSALQRVELRNLSDSKERKSCGRKREQFSLVRSGSAKQAGLLK